MANDRDDLGAPLPGVVELRGAYVWTCRDCGQGDQLCHLIVADGFGSGDAFLADAAGGAWVMIPGLVTCFACGGIFCTLTPGVDDDDSGVGSGASGSDWSVS